MEVYIVCGVRYYHKNNEIESHIVKIFGSEDKAIEFIQKLISKQIGSENCIIYEVPSKEYIRKNSLDIPFRNNAIYEDSYNYSGYNVY